MHPLHTQAWFKGQKPKEMHLRVKAEANPTYSNGRDERQTARRQGPSHFSPGAAEPCRDDRGTGQTCDTTPGSNGVGADWSRLRHHLLKAQHFPPALLANFILDAKGDHI